MKKATTRTINAILRRDPAPPERMTKPVYRRWLRTLATDDLADYHNLIKKSHPQ